MNILFCFLGVAIVIFIVIVQFMVCKKYLFDDAFTTKINENKKVIIIKKQMIPFVDIKNIRIRDLDLSLAERFLVSSAFFCGVLEMELNLINGSKFFVRLPKNAILDFCKRLENNGVIVEYF